MRYSLIIIICLAAISCNHHQKPDVNKMADDFADVECRAISLREKRFAIANEIRFAQDTIINSSDKSDTLRLHNRIDTLSKQKEAILEQSRMLADSIKYMLDSMQANILTDTAAKRSFNDALNAALAKRGCAEQP